MDDYEGSNPRPFNIAVRHRSQIRRWFRRCVGCALVLCAFACCACGIHRELIHVVEVDTAYHSGVDTCTVEIWRQYFPRRITKFRVVPNLQQPIRQDKCP